VRRTDAPVLLSLGKKGKMRANDPRKFLGELPSLTFRGLF
jgi:hypothetical protein